MTARVDPILELEEILLAARGQADTAIHQVRSPDRSEMGLRLALDRLRERASRAEALWEQLDSGAG